MPKKTISRKMNKKNISKKMRRKRTKQRKVQKKSRKKGGYRGRRKSMKGGAAAPVGAAERVRVLQQKLAGITGIQDENLFTQISSNVPIGILVGQTSISDLITDYFKAVKNNNSCAPKAKKRRVNVNSLKVLANNELIEILNSFDLFNKNIDRDKLLKILQMLVDSKLCGKKLEETAQILIRELDEDTSIQEITDFLTAAGIIGQDTEKQLAELYKDVHLDVQLKDALAMDVLEYLKETKVPDLEFKRKHLRGLLKTTFAKVHFYYQLALDTYKKVFGNEVEAKDLAKEFIRIKQREVYNRLTITASPPDELIKDLALIVVAKIISEEDTEGLKGNLKNISEEDTEGLIGNLKEELDEALLAAIGAEEEAAKRAEEAEMSP